MVYLKLPSGVLQKVLPKIYKRILPGFPNELLQGDAEGMFSKQLKGISEKK